jgi:hypothetical protein
MYADGVAMRV